MMENDLIKDILKRVQITVGNIFTNDLSTKIEFEVRQAWSGRPYYVKFNKTLIDKRNNEMRRLFNGGFVTKEMLMQRYDLTQRQIYRILKYRHLSR